MAKKLIYVDDIDGTTTEDVQHFDFSIDGESYGIDLGPANAKKFKDTFALYIASAERTGSSARRSRFESSDSSPAQQNASKEQLAAIRNWARQNGMEVSDRGRVSQAVKDAFDAAH